MAYLTLNGVTVPVAVDSVSMSFEDVGGERERSPLGELVGGPIATKREWRMSTTPLPVSEVDAWIGLIEGAGHTFPFDVDLYSARGRGTSAGTATLITPGAKWGAKFARLTTTNTVAWNLGYGAAWTTLFWYASNAGAIPWTHAMARSGAVGYLNGVTQSSIPDSLGPVFSGSFILGDGEDILTVADVAFDDAVALPYVVPDAWVLGMYTQHNASAWSALPRVLAAGDFSASSVTVRGKVTGSKVIRHSRNGSLTSGHLLDFTLREV